MGILYPTGPIKYLRKQVSGLAQFQEEHGDRFETLTDREIEVLRLVAGGSTNRAVSVKLNISEVTVQNHRASIREKLGITHASDYIKYALAFELIRF